MPGLVPGIHVLAAYLQKRRGWPGIRRAEATPSFGRLCPAMTKTNYVEGAKDKPMKSSFHIALTLAALTLAACSHRGDSTVSLGDDDAFCRANNVQVGSAEYVACRKDRDVQRSHAADRADQKQRQLGEYMLNNPVRP
jgi:hypothetical protein